MASLTFYIVGMGRKVRKRFSGNLSKILSSIYESDAGYRKIILSLIDKPLPLEEIVKKTGLNVDECKLYLKDLTRSKLLRERNGVFSNVIPCFDTKNMKKLSKKAEKITGGMVEVAEEYVNELAHEWEKNGKDWSWGQVSHFFIDMFVLDILFLRAIKSLEKKNGVWEKRTTGQRVVPAFFIEQNKDYQIFGVNTYITKKLVILHGSIFEREERELIKLFESRKVWQAVNRLKVSRKVFELDEEIAKLMLEFNWIEKENGEYHLTIPVIHAKEIERFIPKMAEASVSIAEKAIEHYPKIIEMYEKSPYALYLEGPGDFIDYIYHVMMLKTILKLMRKGLLPKIPKPTPWNVGVYLLDGKISEIMGMFFKMYKEVRKMTGVETEWGKISLKDRLSFFLLSKFARA